MGNIDKSIGKSKEYNGKRKEDSMIEKKDDMERVTEKKIGKD